MPRICQIQPILYIICLNICPTSIKNITDKLLRAMYPYRLKFKKYCVYYCYNNNINIIQNTCICLSIFIDPISNKYVNSCP